MYEKSKNYTQSNVKKCPKRPNVYAFSDVFDKKSIPDTFEKIRDTMK